MVKFYAMRIKLNKMTINEVPEKWRKEVAKLEEGRTKEE